MKKKSVFTLVLALMLVFAVQVFAADMEGVVTAIDKTANTIKVEKVVLDAGSVDISKFAVGDMVKVTYREKGKKNILESITPLMEGC